MAAMVPLALSSGANSFASRFTLVVKEAWGESWGRGSAQPRQTPFVAAIQDAAHPHMPGAGDGIEVGENKAYHQNERGHRPHEEPDGEQRGFGLLGYGDSVGRGDVPCRVEHLAHYKDP